MIERTLSRILIPVRKRIVERKFDQRNIILKEIGKKPLHGMVLLTHPTIEDSLITRMALPESFLLVTNDALKITKYERINRFRALVISAMVPVYKGLKEKRAITYKTGANILNSGALLTIAPTGTTTLSQEIPKPEELILGGLIKILRSSSKHNKVVTPAIRYVSQPSIQDDGTIANGSTVYMIYGDPVSVPPSFLETGIVSDEIIKKFANDVYVSWKKALSAGKLIENIN